MNRFILSCFVILWLFSCRSNQDEVNFEIVFSLDSVATSSKSVLKIQFNNHTNQNLVVPNMIVYRRMFGVDQRPYLYQQNRSTIDGRVGVPYAYSKQVPALQTEMELHKKAKMLRDRLAPMIWGPAFAYMENDTLSPYLIFVRANSQKELNYSIKPEIRGKFEFSFYNGKDLEKDKSALRVLRILDSTFSGRIRDYQFTYKNFKITPLQVTF